MATTQYKLSNPEPQPTPPDGTILHFVPDADSEHFAEFSQDCAYYLPLLRWHDETQQLAEVGVGTIRTNVPVMITYVAVLSSYVLGGMPANKDLNEWHEYAAPQDIGPGSAKYHYRDFGLNIDVDFTAAPRHDAVSSIHNGASSGTVTVKFATTLSGVQAMFKGIEVDTDYVLDPGDTLHMVGTPDGWWRIIYLLIDGGSGSIGDPAPVSDWPMIRNSIDVGETHTIPARFQMIVNESMTVDGTLNTLGELVVLDDVPEPISPDFTYTATVLTRIDYAGGEYKTFTYGGGGELTVVDYISNGITKRKEFFYGVGGELDYITQSYV